MHIRKCMVVRKWKYTDEMECGLLINACGCKYVRSKFPNVVVLCEQHHVSGHDQKLNVSKISFSAA